MRKPIYACDRCGHWYTTDASLAGHELPYESSAYYWAGHDLCGSCGAALHAEKPANYKEWFLSGKGAEVRPKGL